jgi:hypothetical protein
VFRKLDLFPSSGKKKGAPTLLGQTERANLNHWIEVSSFLTDPITELKLALSNGPNRVGAPFVLPDDRNRSSFRNIVTLDDGQSPGA